jgi:sugar phosphate isomerase/epimerase
VSSLGQRFLLGCFTRPFADFSLAEAFAGIAAAGFKYAGLMASHQKVPSLPAAGGPQSVAEIRQLAKSAGVTLTSIILGRPDSLDEGKCWVEDCQALGIYHMIIINPWPYSQGLDVRRPEAELRPEEEAYYRLMHDLADYAEPRRVALAIKPHTGCTATAKEERQTLRAIGQKNVGVYYDPGNVSFYEGVRPEEDLPKIVDRVIGICVKDHQGARANPSFPVPGSGQVNWRRIFQTLCDGGASGPCLLENFTAKTREEVNVGVRKTCEHLTAVLNELA